MKEKGRGQKTESGSQRTEEKDELGKMKMASGQIKDTRNWAPSTRTSELGTKD
jgi:hypothetical protein